MVVAKWRNLLFFRDIRREVEDRDQLVIVSDPEEMTVGSVTMTEIASAIGTAGRIIATSARRTLEEVAPVAGERSNLLTAAGDA